MAQTGHTKKRKSDPASVLEWAANQYAGMIWTTDAAMIITSSHGAGHASLGITPNQFVGKSLKEYFGTEDPNFPVLAAHRRVISGESVTMEQHWQGRDFRSTMQPLHDADGAIIGCLGVTRDVTERRRIARALPQYVAQMTAVTERPPDYVIQIDSEGKITYAHGTAPGDSPPEVIGKRVQQWIRPETLPFAENVLHNMATSGRPQRIEIPAMGPGGADCWYDIRLRPIKQGETVVGGVVVVYDITDRKQLELRLRQQAELLRQVLAHIPHAVFWKDLHGCYLGCNENFALHVGLSSPDDVVGRSDYNLPLAAQQTAWLEQHDRHVIDTGQPVLNLEQTTRLPDGREATVLSSKVPLRDAAGKVVGVLGIFADISNLKLAHEALLQSEDRFRRLAENLPGVVYLCRDEERNSMLFLNDAVESLTGYAKQDFLDQRVGLADLCHAEDAPQVATAIREALERRGPFRLTYRIRRQDGQWRWVDEMGIGVYLEDELLMVEGFLTDISERKLAEQRLRESQQELERRVGERTKELTDVNRQLREGEQRLQSILDNATAVVYVKDLEGRYLLVNSQFTRLFHLTSEQVLGRTDLDAFPAEMAERFRENDRRVMAELTPLEFDEVAPHDDGLHNYISIKFPLRDSTGRPYALCGISTDITDRKLAEEKLRGEEQLLRKMLELRERERQLISYEIHDGFVQDVVAAKMILEATEDDASDTQRPNPKRRKAVLQLLSDAIEEGRRMISELRPLILDEQGIIGSIEYLIAEHLNKNKLVVRFTHQASFHRLPPLLEGALFRIVQESLNNVLRHSQVSAAEVRLCQVDRRLHLEVRDAGVGFELSQVPPDRFGIRGIVERARLFGGAAKIESRPGEGTRVSVEIPLENPSPPESTSQSPPSVG